MIAIAGRQHADQLAAALLAAGDDPFLHHAAPIRPSLQAMLAGRHRYHALAGLGYRGGNRLFPIDVAQRVAQAMFERFDRSIARALPRSRARAFIGYENGALASMRAAKQLGITTILDAASVHHSMQAEAGLRDFGTAYRRHVNARKDGEIALSDHILTCSELARGSYIDAGVAAERVHSVPLGFDPGSFGPASDAAPREGPLRLAFVGRFTRVKGADLLAEALAVLAARGLAFNCRIAAAEHQGDADTRARLAAHATLLGKVAHGELARLYQWADLLVMPSRFDSFGLVVPEALACGLPVLASDRVGARDFITDGVSGEVIPAHSADALIAALARHAADPRIARAMRPAAIEAAKGAQWSDYRRRAAAKVAEILDAAPRARP